MSQEESPTKAIVAAKQSLCADWKNAALHYCSCDNLCEPLLVSPGPSCSGKSPFKLIVNRNADWRVNQSPPVISKLFCRWPSLARERVTSRCRIFHAELSCLVQVVGKARRTFFSAAILLLESCWLIVLLCCCHYKRLDSLDQS